MARETPLQLVAQYVDARFAIPYSPNWNDLDARSIEMLREICDKDDLAGADMIGEAYTISERDLGNPDNEDAWRIAMFLMRGLVVLDRDLRNMRYIIVPRPGTTMHHRSGGFRSVPLTGDPDVAQPRRKRALNLGDE